MFGTSFPVVVYGFQELSSGRPWNCDEDTDYEIQRFATHLVRYEPMGVVYGVSGCTFLNGACAIPTELALTVHMWRDRVVQSRGEDAVSPCDFFLCIDNDDTRW